MAKSPTKSHTSHINTKGAKAPGKTILPRNKFQRQRRFSLIDSDSDSSLSEFESEDEEAESNNNNHHFKSNKFHAIESESEDDDDESDDDDSESTNEEIWKNHAKKVVNTSSTSSEGENDSGSDSDSSSSDDEDVDFVKLTAERKARSLEHYRSNSPFKSPSPTKKTTQKDLIDQDVDFSFNFNNDDHQLRIANEEEEEDLGEELSGIVSPLAKNNNNIPGGDSLPYPTIEDSSDDDIDKAELLRTLEQDSDGVDGGLGTGDDEYNLLREEADNILNEYDGDQLLSSNNATPRNSVVEDMITKHKAEVNPNGEVLQYVSDDDYADDDDDYDDDDELNEDFIVPFFDDSVFKEQLYSNSGNNNNTNKQKELDSDDDSYLWDYFFSSGDESGDDDDDQEDNEHSNHFSDDEATDEDETLPPPSSRKKVGSKAQELLSSSSITARPPALGTWSTDSKPFGIIDGLSTRSLLPAQNRSLSTANSMGQQQKHTPSTPISSSTSNNIEELTLDELLNMSELEDDNDDEQLNHQDWLEVTGSNRKVPLSAFRNKGIVNDQSHINATRRFSASNTTGSGKKLNKKLGRKINEITMTPVRNISNKHSKQKKKNSKLRRRQSIAEAAVEGLRVTKSGLFSEDTLTNVEEFLSGLGNEAELSVLFREIQ